MREGREVLVPCAVVGAASWQVEGARGEVGPLGLSDTPRHFLVKHRGGQPTLTHSKDGEQHRMVKLTTLAVLSLSVILSACATRAAQSMLPDGNTWDMRAANPSKCAAYNSVDTCIMNLRPVIEAQARNVCGKEPARISNCQFAQNAVGGLHGLQCYVKCDERTTIEVQAPAAQTSTRGIDPEVVAKAKRCQSKGGVWINDVCQLVDP
jgi:hypothetical protein